MDELAAIAEAPVLPLDFVKDPVVVESLELLRHGRDWLVRARSRDGLAAD